jgi:hypothetical protein
MARDSETDTEYLARELARLRRRAARQKRKIKSGSHAWQKWSATMEKIASLTQRLVARPAVGLEGLDAKFKAILWLIELNESLLDTGDLRRLRRFGRDLSSLAAGEQ